MFPKCEEVWQKGGKKERKKKKAQKKARKRKPVRKYERQVKRENRTQRIPKSACDEKGHLHVYTHASKDKNIKPQKETKTQNKHI